MGLLRSCSSCNVPVRGQWSRGKLNIGTRQAPFLPIQGEERVSISQPCSALGSALFRELELQLERLCKLLVFLLRGFSSGCFPLSFLSVLKGSLAFSISLKHFIFLLFYQELILLLPPTSLQGQHRGGVFCKR